MAKASTRTDPARHKAPAPLAIQYRPTGDLIPYARNARTHSEAQVALIAGSIREFGFTNPVPLDPSTSTGLVKPNSRI